MVGESNTEGCALANGNRHVFRAVGNPVGAEEHLTPTQERRQLRLEDLSRPRGSVAMESQVDLRSQRVEQPDCQFREV